MSLIKDFHRHEFSWEIEIEEQVRWLSAFRNKGPNELLRFDIIKAGGEGMIDPVYVRIGEEKEVIFVNNNDTLFISTKVKTGENEAGGPIFEIVNTKENFSDIDFNKESNIIVMSWNVTGPNTRANETTHQVIIYPKTDNN